MHHGEVHDQIKQVFGLLVGCIQGPDCILGPQQVVAEVIQFDLDGRLVARAGNLPDVVFIAVLLPMGKQVDGGDDIFLDTPCPKIIERHVRVFDDVMQDAGLLLQVGFAGDANRHQVQDCGISDQVLLAGMRIERDAERFFDGHDDNGIG